MNTRERILAFLVGGLIAVFGIQYGFNKYRAAIAIRESRIESLEDQIFQSEVLHADALVAGEAMERYVARSLPGDKERGLAAYNRFLGKTLTDAGLGNVSSKPTTTIELPLYLQLNYKVSGVGNLRQILQVLHRFHSTNALHRMKSMSITKQQDQLFLQMTVHALALRQASVDGDIPSGVPPRIAGMDVDDYLLPILNRNPFSPPNRTPTYAADREIEAVSGEEFTYIARFNDPDKGQSLSYEVVGEIPDGIRLDPTSGQLRGRFNSPGNVELKLIAKDDGWPAMSAEQQIVINVVAPPPEEVKPEPPRFDESNQTFLTGLTQYRGAWMAMLHVRTSGTTLRLKEGDPFEIGQLKGTVVEVNNKVAILESNGERFELRYEISLADALKNSAP